MQHVNVLQAEVVKERLILQDKVDGLLYGHFTMSVGPQWLFLRVHGWKQEKKTNPDDFHFINAL